jgi:hypothetical protein
MSYRKGNCTLGCALALSTLMTFSCLVLSVHAEEDGEGAERSKATNSDISSIVEVTPDNWRETLLASTRVVIVLTLAENADRGRMSAEWAEQAARHPEVVFAIADATAMGFDSQQSSVSVLVPDCGTSYLRSENGVVLSGKLGAFVEERISVAKSLASNIVRVEKLKRASRADLTALQALLQGAARNKQAQGAIEERLGREYDEIVELKLAISAVLTRDIDKSFFKH